MPKDAFQILTLECPYDHWHRPDVRDWFGKVIDLKLKGYRREYPYGVLPIDTSDFIATHLIIATKTEEGLHPVMAYRSVYLDRCEKHSLQLPAISLMKQLNAFEHVAQVQSIIDRCKEKKLRLCYASSLAVDTQYAGNPELRDILKMINVYHSMSSNVSEIIAGGVLKFKMNKIYHDTGYTTLKNENGELSPLAIPFVCNELTGFFHLTKFSEQALKIAKKYESLWENRIEITALEKYESNKKAA